MNVKEYNDITNIYEDFIDSEIKLKKNVIKAIKKIFEEKSINSYNLIENDIFIALYDDGSDYHTILCENIGINKYDMLVVTSNDNAEYDDEDISASVLYFIFTSLYEKMYEE